MIIEGDELNNHVEKLCDELKDKYPKSHEDRINTLKWGRNLDKEGNMLEKTEWVFIKDMHTEHIKSIILNKYCTEGIYYDTFIEELNRRIKK